MSAMKFLYRIQDNKSRVFFQFVERDKTMNKKELAKFIDNLYHIHNEMIAKGEKT